VQYASGIRACTDSSDEGRRTKDIKTRSFAAVCLALALFARLLFLVRVVARFGDRQCDEKSRTALGLVTPIYDKVVELAQPELVSGTLDYAGTA
jgi:hypothetical protein